MAENSKTRNASSTMERMDVHLTFHTRYGVVEPLDSEIAGLDGVDDFVIIGEGLSEGHKEQN
jgi:hypothetical protein